MYKPSDPFFVLHKLEGRIEKLRIQYEQFFCDVSKVMPSAEHNRVRAEILKLAQEPGVNTRFLYYLNSLKSRLLSLEYYWRRSLNRKELGLSKRDHFKVKKLKETWEKEETSEKKLAAQYTESHPEIKIKDINIDEEIDELKMRRLYSAYVSTKRKYGYDTDKITYEKIYKSIAKQIPIVKEKYKCSEVDFKVRVKDNKVSLVIIPKRNDG